MSTRKRIAGGRPMTVQVERFYSLWGKLFELEAPLRCIDRLPARRGPIRHQLHDGKSILGFSQPELSWFSLISATFWLAYHHRHVSFEREICLKVSLETARKSLSSFGLERKSLESLRESRDFNIFLPNKLLFLIKWPIKEKRLFQSEDNIWLNSH